MVTIPATWPLIFPVPMAIIGHSGDVNAGPEDTLQAVVAATTSGADGVEFDVNRSADGTWWLLHEITLDATTTGTGSPQQHTDEELGNVRIDAGTGVTRAGELVPLARLDTVLDRLAGYVGTVIVDCKDGRPGAHRALATLLAARGMYPSVIAVTPRGAAEVKAVDPRFRVMTFPVQTIDPNIDAWLGVAGGNVDFLHVTGANLFGDAGMYIPSELWGQDERPLLDNGRRWGVSFVITNDIAAAIAWRETAEGRQ